MSNHSEEETGVSAISVKLRTERVRVFVVSAETAQPVPGVPLTITAEIGSEEAEELAKIPVGMLESDRFGYASLKLGRLSGDKDLKHVWFSPFGNKDIAVDAFPVIDGLIDPAIITISLPAELIPKEYLGPRLPSVPEPDSTDWKLSPRSLASHADRLVGEGPCEELLISREAERSSRFVQLVVDGSEPEGLTRISRPECETQTEFDAYDFATDRCIRRGAMLEYEVTWTPFGHGLGRVLYSLPLAPCESVNIAVIDWQRQDDIARSEDTSVSEQLFHNQRRDRDIEEIVTATIRETQEGGSFLGGLGGALSGMVDTLTFGATTALGGGYSGSSGDRRIAAETTHHLTDAIAQQSSSFRRLNSTVVVQASQAEQEHLQTRTVANHNHCHALTVLYYEVVRHYSVSVRLVDKRDVVFVQYHLGENFKQGSGYPFDYQSIHMNHQVLKNALLDKSLIKCFEAAKKRYCSNITFEKFPPPVTSSDFVVNNIRAIFRTGEPGMTERHTIQIFLVTQENQRIRLQHDGSLLTYDGNPMPPNYLGGFTREEFGDSEATHAFSANQEDIFTLRPSDTIRWERVKGIEIEANRAWRLENLTMRTSEGGVTWEMLPEDVSFTFGPEDESRIKRWTTESIGPSTAEEVLSEKETCCLENLTEHLERNKVYYSRALWLNQDPQERQRVFTHYAFAVTARSGETLRGRLADFIENRIVGVVGDYVAFPLSVENFAYTLDTSDGESERIVTLPTRGVFAEAKLSHCNACEERDVTRYWDWSQSPCPEPPEITGVEAGEREVRDLPEGTPTPFPGSLVNIVNPPAAPDPTGLASALEVLRTSDIFRDMSGRQEVSELLQRLATEASNLAGAAHDRLQVIRSAKNHGDIDNETFKESIKDNLPTPPPPPEPVGEPGPEEGGDGDDDRGGEPRRRRERRDPRERTIQIILNAFYDNGAPFDGDFEFNLRGPNDESFTILIPVERGLPGAESVSLLPGTWGFGGRVMRTRLPDTLTRSLPVDLPEPLPDFAIPLSRHVVSTNEWEHRGIFTVADDDSQVVLISTASLGQDTFHWAIDISGSATGGVAPEVQVSQDIRLGLEGAIRRLVQGSIEAGMGLAGTLGVNLSGTLELGGSVSADLEYNFVESIRTVQETE